MKIVTILTLLIATLLHAKVDIPAFPGAEGGGAASKGGRGGKVYVVSNLNDRGKGSLRYGLEQLKGVRTIVFRVGGYIHLSDAIRVKDDGFITIAAQTAPGDGITLTTVDSREPIFIFTRCHDLIIRYLRLRKGGTKATGQHGSGLALSGSAENIMIDHCSVSWTGDDNFDFWGSDTFKNITVQQSISAEGLNYDHPATGLIIGGSANIEKMTDISIHHNLFANNKNRNPLLKVASGDIISNIVYNWSWWATGLSGGITVDIINNQYKAGPNTRNKGRGEIVFKSYEKGHKKPAMTGLNAVPSIYIQGNVGPHNDNPRADNWNTMMEHANHLWGYPIIKGKPTKSGVPLRYRRNVPRISDYPVTLTPAYALEKALLREGGVGASQRLNADGEWVFNRDVVDQRIIQEYRSGQGTLVQKVDDVGGWPYYTSQGDYRYVKENHLIAQLNRYALDGGEAYLDTDKDGMPDRWEDKYGLDKHNHRDAVFDKNSNGYDNLEEFLNKKIP